MFTPTSINHVRIFLILFCVTLAFQLIWSFRDQLLYFKTLPSKTFGTTSKLLGYFRLPPINLALFVISGTVLIASLITAAAGVLPRLSILVALMCYFFYFGQIRLAGLRAQEDKSGRHRSDHFAGIAVNSATTGRTHGAMADLFDQSRDHPNVSVGRNSEAKSHRHPLVKRGKLTCISGAAFPLGRYDGRAKSCRTSSTMRCIECVDADV